MLILTPSLCRAGRALVDMTQADLAKASGVNLRTINEYERENRPAYDSTRAKLQAALEAAGVVFLTVGDIDGLGVRRR